MLFILSLLLIPLTSTQTTPSLTIKKPVSNSVITQSLPFIIKWKSSYVDQSAPTTVELLAGNTTTLLTTAVIPTHIFKWIPTSPGKGKIRITQALYKGGFKTATSQEFIVGADPNVPLITVYAPGNTTLSLGSKIVIKWKAVNVQQDQNTKVSLVTNGGVVVLTEGKIPNHSYKWVVGEKGTGLKVRVVMKAKKTGVDVVGESAVFSVK